MRRNFGVNGRPARIQPTFAGVPTDIACQQLVSVQWKRRKVLGWFRKPLGKPVVCGTALEIVAYRRKLRCPSCARAAKLNRRERLVLNPPPYGVGQMLAVVAVGMARMFKGRA